MKALEAALEALAEAAVKAVEAEAETGRLPLTTSAYYRVMDAVRVAYADEHYAVLAATLAVSTAERGRAHGAHVEVVAEHLAEHLAHLLRPAEEVYRYALEVEA